MESAPLYFLPPDDHYFLLGPRGTGKTWLTQRRYPDALRIDLLDPEILRTLSIGMAERTGRILLGQLFDEGLLLSDTPKGAVRLGLRTHLVGHLFPDLYPQQIVSRRMREQGKGVRIVLYTVPGIPGAAGCCTD